MTVSALVNTERPIILIYTPPIRVAPTNTLRSNLRRRPTRMQPSHNSMRFSKRQPGSHSSSSSRTP